MKVTLIFPARENDLARGLVSIPPAGITRLAALVPGDTEVKLVDMLSDDEVHYDDAVDLVGITVRTPVAAVAYEIADRFRARGVPVVLGGPHVSAVPLDAALHADAVAVGEAETTWPRLLADFGNGDLKQFYVCGPLTFDPGDSSLFHEPQLPPLDGLPLPRNELFPRRRYLMDTLLTTRGCPFDCSFCPVSNLFGKKPRHRPVEEVVQEVASMKKRIYFNLDDNVFGVPGDEDYYLELYSALSKRKGRKIWIGQAGLGVVETRKGREILKLAVKSGLTSVSVGIESISAQGLVESNAGKKLSGNGDIPGIEKILRQISILREQGLFILGWFVMGWEGDTKETYKRTLAFCERAGVAPIMVNLSPLPGTRCYDDYVESGRMKPDLTWEDFSVDGDKIIYYHANLSEKEMVAGVKTSVREAYSIPRMLRRSIDFTRRRPLPISFPMTMMMQQSFRKRFR